MGLKTWLGLKASKQDYRLNLLRSLPRGGRCVEIGVWRGQFSQLILDVKRPDVLHLVDPWQFCPEFPLRMYGGKSVSSQSEMDGIAASVEARFRSHPEVRIHRSDSATFFSGLYGSLDWIYIDGDHSETAVYADLVAAWRALSPGGMITGDDVKWRDSDGSRSVERALSRFGSEIGVSPKLDNDQFSISKPD